MSGDFQTELFYLKWNNFQKNVSTQFEKLRETNDLIDITFACENKLIGAHKLVLFACSPYFKAILKKNPCQHPVFYMNEVKFDILKAILEYMYLGEVHLSNENLKEFIKTAESLQIRGLTSKDSSQQEQTVGDDVVDDVDPSVEEEDEEVQVRIADDLVVFDEYYRKRQFETETQSNCSLKKVKITKSGTEPTVAVLTEKTAEAMECNSSSDSGQQQDQNLSTSSTQLSNSSSKQVEMKIEMLEEYANQAQHQQQSSPTYCNMDTFGDKSDGKSTVDQLPNRPSTSSYQLQATPTQQQPQQLPQHQTQYKIDDEIWLETTLMHNPPVDQTSKKRPNSTSPTQQTQAQQQQNKSQNCLTPRSCPLCSRTYSNVSNLRQHMRLVHHPTTVQCPICRKSFNSNLYLKRHYSTMHNADEKNSTWIEQYSIDAVSPATAQQLVVVPAQGEQQNVKIK